MFKESMELKKRYLIFGLLILILLGASIFKVILPIIGFSIFQKDIVNEKYLENLKLNVGLECLKNSQCDKGSECVDNSCIEKLKINDCESTDLYFRAIKLMRGDSINSLKSIITDTELPYLLPDGELVEIVEGKIIEHFYTQTIIIGNNPIEEDKGYYLIKTKSDEPIYTYILTFSKDVDFSNKKIQGQVLRILGKEYVIGSKSNNDKIELISEDKKITLEDNNNKISILKSSEDNVLSINVPFYVDSKVGNIKAMGNNVDNIFDSVKLSFNYVSTEGFADVKIGRNC